MARTKVTLNHAGIAAILKGSEMHALIEKVTEAVAENASGQGVTVGAFKGGSGEIALPVASKVITTDRAHGIVTLAHPAGIASQAKHGVLTKAAAAAGLQVGGASTLLKYTTKSGKTRTATQAQIDNWTRGR